MDKLKENDIFKKGVLVFLFTMLFSPLLSYFILISTNGDKNAIYYFSAYTIILGIIFVLLGYKNNFPKELYLFILYIIFILIWSFYNGDQERRGFINIIINNPHHATLFVIYMVYNLNFSDRFIKYTLNIFKVTAVLAVIVSIYQVFDSTFLDANPYWQRIGGQSDILGDMYQDRRLSIFGFSDLNELGLSYLPFASAMLGFLLTKKNKYYVLFFLFVGLTSVLSNNRYVIVGYIIILIQFFTVKKLKSPIKIINTIIILVILGLLLNYALVSLGYNYGDWFSERLFVEGAVTESTRYGAFINFIYFFPQAVFVGTGVHLTTQMALASESIGSSQIHVGYLAHLLSYGIVGSFFLFGFWLMLLIKLYNNAKKTKYWGSFFAFLIFLWAQTTLVYYFIFFYGIIFALIMDKYMIDKYKLQNNLEKGFIEYD